MSNKPKAKTLKYNAIRKLFHTQSKQQYVPLCPCYFKGYFEAGNSCALHARGGTR